MENEFRAMEELRKVRQERARRKKRRTWGRSKLDPHRGSILDLRYAGASLEDVRFWLQKNKGIKVVCSTILRFEKKHRTASEDDHG